MEHEIKVFYTTQVGIKEPMKIELRIPNYCGFVNSAKAVFNRYGEKPGQAGECILSYDVEKSNNETSTFVGTREFDQVGYVTFYIEIYVNEVPKAIKIDPISLEPTFATMSDNMPFFEMSVFHRNIQAPDGIAGGIMYQIFLDTFYSEEKSNLVEWSRFPKWEPDPDGEYRNDYFYGGDIKGIIHKVHYLQSLGVTILYLTPVFESPSQHRYDISNYEAIDKRLGTWEDLKHLKEALNNVGIKLILDCVFNHSSNENPLVETVPEIYDWEEKYTRAKTWSGFANMYEFNKSHPDYYVRLGQWLDKYYDYCDGIRLDLAELLPDEVLTFIKSHFASKYVLGEVWPNAVKGANRGFLLGFELDAVMNYQYPNAIYRYLRYGNYRYFRRIVVNEVYNLYPRPLLDICPIFLSSHDIPRIPNILVGEFMKEDPMFSNIWDMEKNSEWFDGCNFKTYRFRKWEFEHDERFDKDLAFKLQKLAVFMQYTLPGMPSVFAGDEMGVSGYKDPFNRKPMPWHSMDGRVYSYYAQMGKFRGKYANVFAHGDLEIFKIDKHICVYRRENMIFVVNRTAEPRKVGDYVNGKTIVYNAYNGERVEYEVEKSLFIDHILGAYNAVALV